MAGNSQMKRRKIREREHFLEIFKNTGRWNYSALGSRRVPIYWLDSYILIFVPSWEKCKNIKKTPKNTQRMLFQMFLYLLILYYMQYYVYIYKNKYFLLINTVFEVLKFLQVYKMQSVKCSTDRNTTIMLLYFIGMFYYNQILYDGHVHC